jgi:hypothetical protein
MPYFNLLQSVLDGYNGTIMAYGQTGTGKTYTLGRLGEEDTAARGIMVRAMEDIFADVSLETDSISVSYLQVLSKKIYFGMTFQFRYSTFINSNLSFVLKYLLYLLENYIQTSYVNIIFLDSHVSFIWRLYRICLTLPMIT